MVKVCSVTEDDDKKPLDELFGGAFDDDVPNVVWTKFVGFLNNFVKLLVLNDNRLLAADVVVDSTPFDDVDWTPESDLTRLDFVF